MGIKVAAGKYKACVGNTEATDSVYVAIVVVGSHARIPFD